ncbi:MAG: DUF3383 domain-containing protein [Sulfuricella sp.]
MANLGLSVSDVVNVSIVMSPKAAQTRNFGSLLILGDSNVVDTLERLRLYTSLDGIASDFGTTAPEYLAAKLFFGQTPQPTTCYVGKWAKLATSGILRGAILTAPQQALANFTAITTGAMGISIDGSVQNVTALNLSGVANLNAAASALQAKLTGATVTWDAYNGRFIIKSNTTGTTSVVAFATAPGSGVDVSSLFGLKSADGGYVSAGVAAESLLAAVTAVANASNSWYGLQIAASAAPADADVLAVAGAVEAMSVSRIYGQTVQNTAVLDAAQTTDIASQLKALGYKRTFLQYCGNNAHAVASIFGRAFTVDFQGSNTTITLKFKQEPGIAPEYLTEGQAAALQSKNCNVFVQYNNDTAILQDGEMVNGYFFDEVHGTDWLQNDVQTDIYNLLYTSTTKIPQTDAGVNRILARISARIEQAVVNGLVAPGVWNAGGFGALNQGDTLAKGYYVYAPPVASQSQADREARKAPTIQAAIKLAGAIHQSKIVINVNR